MTNRLRTLIMVVVATAALSPRASAMERFPPPDFESGYELPGTATPPPRSIAWEYVDVLALLGALSLSTYFALARRSRNGVFAVMLVSLAYFGFWRGGCVCPIGALQNAVLALADPEYAIPLVVVAFFLLPLVFTVLFGRTFCAGVCPLGAIQDVFLLKPVRVPAWLSHALGLLAYVYLGAAVMLAATGSAFLICRYDPFVAFFRLSGSLGMLTLGAAMLVLSVFIGRPYCRFLCPYGAILRHLSSVSKWHVTITPDECVKCRLCEDSCPFGAIQAPNAEEAAPPRRAGLRRLTLAFIALPVLVVLGAFLGGWASEPLAGLDYTIRLAERLRQEEAGLVEGTNDQSDSFRASGRAAEDLFEEADGKRRSVTIGSWIFGAWVGLVLGVKLISLSVRRRRVDYEPDPATCVSCARCFMYCPRERLRLKDAAGAPEAAHAKPG